jgi:hypothetical protein
MKKIIKYISSLFFIFLLFPMSVFAHGPGEKVSVSCSSHISLSQDVFKKWRGYMHTRVALTDSLLKSHNAINVTDGKYPIPIEVEITTKDGEKIQTIAGYNYEVIKGNMSQGYQRANDGFYLFKELSDAEKDEKLRKYGEFLNVTCSFDSHSVEYH